MEWQRHDILQIRLNLIPVVQSLVDVAQESAQNCLGAMPRYHPITVGGDRDRALEELPVRLHLFDRAFDYCMEDPVHQ